MARYIASVLAGYQVGTIAYRATSEVLDWKSVPLEDSDWDVSPGELDRLDVKDAEYNSMTVEEMRKKLK